MGVARKIAKRSSCKHYNVGMVFTKGDQLLSLGYNGAPRKEPNCCEVGCAKEIDGKVLPSGSGMCRGSHAEINAISNASRNGVNLEGCTVYGTWSPCYDCAKHLVNLGVIEFIYETKYKQEFSKVKKLFNNQGISLITFRTKIRKQGEEILREKLGIT